MKSRSIDCFSRACRLSAVQVVRSVMMLVFLTLFSTAQAAIFSTSVVSSTDDAEEKVSDGSMDLNNNKVPLGKDRHVGLRFTNISIPSGAIINSATIRFYATDNDDKIPSSVSIYGQAVDNASTFTSVDGNISSRTRTTAAVNWNIPVWVKDTSGAAQTTPDLAAVVQEIIDRGGWISGNAMAFMLLATGSEERRARTADDGNGPSPILTIDYTLPNEAELAITKTDSVDPVGNGNPFSYTLTVVNNGPTAATTVTVTDVLPAAVSYVSSFTSQGNCSENAGTVTCNIGQLAAAATATVEIVVTAPTFSGTLSNTATVSNPSQPDGTPGNNTDTETTTVTGNIPQLCYMVADGGDILTTIDTSDFNPATNETTIGSTAPAASIEAIAWNSATMTLYAANAGQLGTLSTTTGAFTALPQTFGTGTGALGSITFSDVDGLSYDRTSGILYGTHARAGQDVLIQIDMTTGAHVANAFGLNVDYVVINSALSIVDDIAIDQAGVMYAATNDGGTTDRLITINKLTGATTDIGLITVPDIEGLGMDTFGNLWGTSGTQNQLYEIDKNTGVGSIGRPIDNGSDYEAIDCYAISPSFQVDVGVTKSVDNPTPNEGELVAFTITATNNGPGIATSVTISDALPVGLTFDSASATQGTYDSATGDWFVGTINIGSSATLTLRAVVDTGTAGSLIVNTASLHTVSQEDSDSTNNEDSVEVNPIRTVDLALTKTDGTTTYTPGETGVYVITVTNIAGANDAIGAVVFDDLPDGAILDTAWSCIAVGNASCVSGQPVGTGIAGSTDEPLNQAVDVGAGSGNYVEFTIPVLFSQLPGDYVP